MTVWGKLKQAIRLYGLRFLRFPNATNPPDSQPANSSPLVSFTLGRNTYSEGVFKADGSEVESAENEPLHPQLAAAQRDAVDAIRVGMRRWFGFYFLIDEGADQERLHRAARGLQTASAQLRNIAENLDNISGSDSSSDELLGTYREAVDGWASALDSIARGAVLDQHRIAEDGFAQMANASAVAEQVVDHRARKGRQSMLVEPLASLAELRPPTNVSKRTEEEAKRPWQRAIIAAGSPFRQPK